jgi:hypothetical protein
VEPFCLAWSTRFVRSLSFAERMWIGGLEAAPDPAWISLSCKPWSVIFGVQCVSLAHSYFQGMLLAAGRLTPRPQCALSGRVLRLYSCKGSRESR